MKYYKTNGLNPHIGLDTGNTEYIYLNDIRDGNTYVPIWYDLEVPSINGVATTVNLSTGQTATVSASDAGSGIAGYYIGQTEPTEANYKNGSILFMPSAYASYSKTVADPGTWYFAAIDKDGNWNYTSKKYHKIKADLGTGEPASDIIIAQGTLPTPTRPGYTFEGWYTSPTGGTKITESTAITDGTTIHAHWKVNTYILTFNANGGSCSTANRSVNYGSAYGTLPIPSRTGYTFNGWFTDPNGGIQVSDATVMGVGDTTGYAQWTINNYTLTFNANGGSCSETSRTVTYNSAYGTLPTPSRTGHTFNGWFTAASGGTQVSADTTMGAGDTTVYAHWTINSYTLTFDANGGSCGEGSRTVTYNSAYGTLPTPSRTGGTFDGWFTDATGGTQVSAGTVMGAGDVTVYAHWTLNPHTLTLKVNRYGNTVMTKELSPGSPYGKLPRISYPGYRFVGWYSGWDDDSAQVSESTLMGDEDITIYAHWVFGPPNIYISKPSGSRLDNYSCTALVELKYPSGSAAGSGFQHYTGYCLGNVYDNFLNSSSTTSFGINANIPGIHTVRVNAYSVDFIAHTAGVFIVTDENGQLGNEYIKEDQNGQYFEWESELVNGCIIESINFNPVFNPGFNIASGLFTTSWYVKGVCADGTEYLLAEDTNSSQNGPGLTGLQVDLDKEIRKVKFFFRYDTTATTVNKNLENIKLVDDSDIDAIKINYVCISE